MKTYLRYYATLLYMPLTALIIFVSLFAVWELFSLPPAPVVASSVERLFDTYGLPVLFLSSFLEGALLVGGYFPGTFVILLGVLFADSAQEAVVAVLVAMAGLYAAHCGNYFLGKYGWYRLLVRFGLGGSVENAKGEVLKNQFFAIFSTYWMSSVAAVVDTAAGILRMPTRKFLAYSLVSTLFWGTLVGTLVYIVGDKVLFFASPGGEELGLLMAIVLLWAGTLFALDYARNGLPAK